LLELKPGHDLVDVRRSIHQPGVVVAWDELALRFARVAWQRAHQAFQQVRHRHQPLHRTEFIHDEREVTVKGTKRLEKLEGGHRVGHEQRLAQQRA
jgi:hypothetical protein